MKYEVGREYIILKDEKFSLDLLQGRRIRVRRNLQFLPAMWWNSSKKTKKYDKNVYFLERFIFLQKLCLDTLNAVTTTLPKIPPDVQSQSKKFHYSETNFLLKAIPLTDGVQFCWAMKFY